MKLLLAVALGMISCVALFLAWNSVSLESPAISIRAPGPTPGQVLADAGELGTSPVREPGGQGIDALETAVAPVPETHRRRAEGAAESGLSRRVEEDGPLLQAHYPDGTLEYSGHQVQRANGSWVRDGPWEARHENGELHELGAYRDGVEDGVWKWWYDDGTRMSVGYFENGERHGEWSFWHPNGNKYMDARYRNGLGDGRWVSYHENGVKHAEGDYLSGEISGRWTMWHEDGSVDHERSGLYQDGEKIAD